ncbi:MAG: carboxypeptidase-like regulatory domain-containing protein [Bacteroidales bacterium]|nr:carboxypeptidase-like regulatory domain-containing protein [Bacteroidales bacterium]
MTISKSNYKNFIILSLHIFSSFNACFSQTKIVSGYINDKKTSERLIGVNVYLPSSQSGTISNKFGFFSLKVKEETKNIYFSYVGYQQKIIQLGKSSELFFIIDLEQGIDIDEVVVNANKVDFTQSNETGTASISIAELNKLPEFLGENDIIHAIQLLPGVQSGAEGKASLYIRGGSADQNLILMDDVPFYNISHFGSFISTFNSDAIKDFTLYKGGFPARYGSRLSSVVDIRLKDGDLNSYKTSGSIGLLSSKILFEGPVIKNKSSFLISARKNTLPVFNLFLKEELIYRFYDLNAKFNYKINDKNRLHLSFYSGDDQVMIKDNNQYSNYSDYTKNNVNWGNVNSSFRWNLILSPKIFLNTVIGYTSYHYKTGFENEFSSDTITESKTSKFNSGVNDLFIKFAPEIFISSNYKLRLGAEWMVHSFTPGNTFFEQIGKPEDSYELHFENLEIKAIENKFYIENDIDLFKWLGWNLGFHYSGYSVNKEYYSSFEPRLIANIRLFPNFSIKPAYSEMQQYVHLLTYSGVGMPSDFWMPTTAYVPPQRAKQFSVGFEYLLKEKYKISIETYLKQMDDLIALDQGESFFRNDEMWENKILKSGTGISKGMEFLFRKEEGKTTGWISFTLSESERRFKELNNGNAFPFKYDSRITTNLVLMHEIRENITFSAIWKYRTGYPVTLPVKKYNSFGEDVFVYNEINSFRMKDYHRLDIALKFKKSVKKGERSWNLSVLNLYNRQNPYYYYFQKEQMPMQIASGQGISIYSEEGDLKLYQQSLISFLPSVSYSFKF